MIRNKHSLSHYKLLSADMGKLYPIAAYEVLPGDTVQQSTSLLIRVSPLVAPVMHPVRVRVHHWYVPFRVMWDGWEDFITGGPTGDDAGAPPSVGPVQVMVKSIDDYCGVPPGANRTFNIWHRYAYNLIWNEFYRDQDLSGERNPADPSVASVCWEKDYFTTARPWPQKGPDVSLPLGVNAPVISNGVPPTMTGGGLTNSHLNTTAGASSVGLDGNAPSTGNLAFGSTTGLLADLSNATAVNVNDVRRAFALQRYQEARAMYGSRYTEYLAYLGVRSSDARLQRPEYLGGGKGTISFSEVLKTGSQDDPAEAIGTMKGHGIAALRSRRWRRFFEEHGIILSVLSIRPRTMYAEHMDRMYIKRTREDYWQRELEHIGQQEVFQAEVHADAVADTVFGFQDRYSEYRHIQSSVAADFRTSLNYWHMARSFATPPVLNGSFVLCDPTKRIHAEQTQDVLWIMANHQIQARRMVSNSTVGRIF